MPLDYGLITEPPGTTEDYGLLTEQATVFLDWGFLFDPAVAGFWEQMGNDLRTRMGSVSGLPVSYDNAPAPKAATPWISFGFMVSEQRQTSFGAGNAYRAEAAVQAVIHYPVTLGDGAAQGVADAIVAGFRDQPVGFCRFLQPRVVSKHRAGAWWDIELELPYRADRSSPALLISTGSPDVEEAASVARTRFGSLIEDALAIPTAYENEKFTPPASGRWARVFVLAGDAERADLSPSSPRYRQVGLLIVHALGGSIDGDGSLLRLVDAIDDAFRAVTVGGVVFKAPSPGTRGREGRWWRIDVSIPFYFDSIP